MQSQIELANQVKQLTLPGEMGERFKALALVRNYSAPLMGFQIVEHSSRL